MNFSMKKSEWLTRTFRFGLNGGLLPFQLDRLEGTVARMEMKTKGLPDDILSNKLDMKWSVKENIAHLGEVDEVALKRIDEIVNQLPVMSPAVFGLKQDYNAWPLQKVIDFFYENRKKNIARYRLLADDELSRTSVHPRLKVTMTPVDLAFFDAEHDDHHLVRISEIISTLKK